MNMNRRTILALIALGRITPVEAEQLLSAIHESRETTWILAICLAFVCLTQLHLHEFVPSLVHFFNLEVPLLAASAHHAVSTVADLLGGMR